MMPLVLAVLAVQTGWSVLTPSYTVGDTVVLERFVALPSPAVRLRVAPLERTPDVEPLRPPAVVYQTDGARIRYVVATFSPSPVEVSFPDFDLVRPDGQVDAIPGGVVVVTPTAVLPVADDPDSLPEPKWSQPPISRRAVRFEPVVLFGGTVLFGVLVWGVFRRRVGPRPVWAAATAPRVDPPTMDWISAGEPRAVAALASDQLRRHIADLVPSAGEALSSSECITVLRRERPSWPLAEIGDALSGLDRASFAPAVPSDVLVLVDDVTELMAAIDAPEQDAADPETVDEPDSHTVETPAP